MTSFSVDSKAFIDENSKFVNILDNCFKPSVWMAVKHHVLMFLPNLQRILKLKYVLNEYKILKIKFMNGFIFTDSFHKVHKLG